MSPTIAFVIGLVIGLMGLFSAALAVVISKESGGSSASSTRSTGGPSETARSSRTLGQSEPPLHTSDGIAGYEKVRAARCMMMNDETPAAKGIVLGTVLSLCFWLLLIWLLV